MMAEDAMEVSSDFERRPFMDNLDIDLDVMRDATPEPDQDYMLEDGNEYMDSLPQAGTVFAQADRLDDVMLDDDLPYQANEGGTVVQDEDIYDMIDEVDGHEIVGTLDDLDQASGHDEDIDFQIDTSLAQAVDPQPVEDHKLGSPSLTQVEQHQGAPFLSIDDHQNGQDGERLDADQLHMTHQDIPQENQTPISPPEPKALTNADDNLASQPTSDKEGLPETTLQETNTIIEIHDKTLGVNEDIEESGVNSNGPDHNITDNETPPLHTNTVSEGPSIDVSNVGDDQGTDSRILTSKNPQHHLLELSPVKILYEDSEMSLFPPRTHDDTDTYLLQDESLAYQSLAELLKACRTVLGDSISNQHYLELEVVELAMTITETSSELSEFSLSQILDLYLQLNRNDAINDPPALQLALMVKPSFIFQFQELSAAASEGKAISDLPCWSYPTDDNSEDVQEQAESSEKADAKVEANKNESSHHDSEEKSTTGSINSTKYPNDETKELLKGDIFEQPSGADGEPNAPNSSEVQSPQVHAEDEKSHKDVEGGPKSEVHETNTHLDKTHTGIYEHQFSTVHGDLDLGSEHRSSSTPTLKGDAESEDIDDNLDQIDDPSDFGDPSEAPVDPSISEKTKHNSEPDVDNIEDLDNLSEHDDLEVKVQPELSHFETHESSDAPSNIKSANTAVHPNDLKEPRNYENGDDPQPSDADVQNSHDEHSYHERGDDLETFTKFQADIETTDHGDGDALDNLETHADLDSSKVYIKEIPKAYDAAKLDDGLEAEGKHSETTSEWVQVAEDGEFDDLVSNSPIDPSTNLTVTDTEGLDLQGENSEHSENQDLDELENFHSFPQDPKELHVDDVPDELHQDVTTTSRESAHGISSALDVSNSVTLSNSTGKQNVADVDQDINSTLENSSMLVHGSITESTFGASPHEESIRDSAFDEISYDEDELDDLEDFQDPPTTLEDQITNSRRHSSTKRSRSNSENEPDSLEASSPNTVYFLTPDYDHRVDADMRMRIPEFEEYFNFCK
ncbi:MAG: hypothetical protein M1834_003767 [Cirrosporium novae-zelandiae]|nr:MAG: hypothetical protein M1834_003767 [Cirrosporium novae-zelandiae]